MNLRNGIDKLNGELNSAEARYKAAKSAHLDSVGRDTKTRDGLSAKAGEAKAVQDEIAGRLERLTKIVGLGFKTMDEITALVGVEKAPVKIAPKGKVK